MACPVSGMRASPNASFNEKDMQPITVYEPIAEPILLREIAKEPIFLLGGQYAILLQFAHPGLAQGSLEHSDFAGRILNRLKTTTRFLVACVYGTPEEKEAIMGVIHRKHATVKGGGDEESKRLGAFDAYYADDPELHKWTAATLFMSLIVVHKAIFGEVPRSKQEQLFKETAIYATSLRMPPSMWPKTLDEFEVYWNDGVNNLPITPWAKTLCHQLMYPKYMPFYLHAPMPIARLLTFHWLPERVRNEYGFPETKMKKHMYGFWIAYLRVVYKVIPKGIRTIGHKRYLEDMRRSARRIQETGTWLQEGKTYDYMKRDR